jgi:glutamate carboxypeptidase
MQIRLLLLVALVIPSFFLPAARAALTSDEQKIVAAVNAQAGTFARDLGQHVQLDSATVNLAGIRQLADLYGAQLTALGLNYRFAPLPASTGRAGHLIAEHKGNLGQRVLLIGHLDTVLPGGNYRREGDKAFGSGTSDIKGGNLIIIYALRALHAAGLLANTQIIVVMTGDEEAVGRPVEIAREELFAAAKRSDVALAFESAIGKTGTVARRGSASWEVEVQGATGHSSGIFSAAMGAGSVYEAARILSGFYAERLTASPSTLRSSSAAPRPRSTAPAAKPRARPTSPLRAPASAATSAPPAPTSSPKPRL